MNNEEYLSTLMTLSSKQATLNTIEEKMSRTTGKRFKTLALMRDIVLAEISLLNAKIRVMCFTEE